MSRYSQTYQWDITKIYPFLEIPEALPGERWTLITEDIEPDVLPYYLVTTYGRIYHRFKNSFMTTAWDKGGYRIVILRTKNGTVTRRVHRLVMMAFRYKEGCEDLVVDHINNRPNQNYIDFPVYNPYTNQYELTDNLRWATQSENEHYAFELGVKKYRPPHGNANMSTEKVIEICEYLQDGKMTNRQISEVCNVTLADVENIKYRRSWKDISKNYEFHKLDNRLMDDVVKLICKDLQDNKHTMVEISQKWKIPLDTVKGIKYRKIYNEISKDYIF